MKLQPKSINDILQDLIADTESTYYKQTGELKKINPNSLVYIVLLTVAGALYLHEWFIVWIAKQIFPQTADDEYLDMHAEREGIIRGTARAAILNAQFMITPNSDITRNTLLKYGDYNYRVTTTVKATSTTVIAQIESEESGEQYTRLIGDILEIADVSPKYTRDTAIITAIIQTGENQEDREAYKNRIVFAFANRPRGGARTDYMLWALSVAQITRAYVYAGLPGEVILYVADDTQNMTPSPQKLQEVAHACRYDADGLETRAPMSVQKISVYPVKILRLYIDVIGITQNNNDINTIVKDAITVYTNTREPYIEGISQNKNDIVSVGAINAAIFTTLDALGISYSIIKMYDNQYYTNPQEEFTLGIGRVAILQEVQLS